MEDAKARPAESRPYEHPRRAAEIVAGEAVIGRLFEFHPRMVETGRAAALDLDLTLVQKLQRSDVRYYPLRRFPTAAFDLTVIAPARASIGELESRITTLVAKDLVSIAFLREFTAPDGSRSLSYRITAGASDRTLESEEVSAIRARIIAGLREAGFELKV
jgi:phenylalanyl-tRNA synthetase beta chain